MLRGIAMGRGDNDERTARQISRGKTKKLGDKSSRLARVLMEMKESVVKRLAMDDDLREAVGRARQVVTLVARRRAERTLAGDLRHFDLAELEDNIRKIDDNEFDVRRFHLAEEWRSKLIAEGMDALATFPYREAAVADLELPRLVDAARREHTTGAPPGAAKKLFRAVAELLIVPEAPASGEAKANPDGDFGADE